MQQQRARNQLRPHYTTHPCALLYDTSRLLEVQSSATHPTSLPPTCHAWMQVGKVVDAPFDWVDAQGVSIARAAKGSLND